MVFDHGVMKEGFGKGIGNLQFSFIVIIKNIKSQ